MKLPYLNVDIASDDFQFLEDPATRLKHDSESLGRFMAVLEKSGILVEADGKYENGPLATRYPVQSGPDFVGHFIKYRRYLVPNRQRLAMRIRVGTRQ